MPVHPRRSARRGATFDEYYNGVYGARWPALRRAMAAPSRKVALWNRFCQIPFDEAMRGMRRVDDTSVLQLFCPDPNKNDGDDAHDKIDFAIMDKSPIDVFNVRAYYILDYASALIVEHLQVGSFDRVLDMCAAPGGKTIAVAQFLSPDGSLTANEQRGDRCVRLRRNIKDFVPSNFVPITVTQRDGATWHEPSAYDRVLLDAPCSSERHLLQQGATTEWSEHTTRELSAVQRALLLRAIETCRPGGRVVYSTCSISPMENDGVVAEALSRTRCEVEIRPPTTLRMGERTAHGFIVLPDTAGGWGPMYCCVIHKVSDHRFYSEEESNDEQGSGESDTD